MTNTTKHSFKDRDRLLSNVTEDNEVGAQVRYLASMLMRHNLETALKMTEIDLSISRKDACLLLCEVAGELSAVVKNCNIPNEMRMAG